MKFKISVIIEAENLISANSKFMEFTNGKLEAKQITRLPTTETRMKLRKKIESLLSKMDSDIVNAIFSNEDYSLSL